MKISVDNTVVKLVVCTEPSTFSHFEELLLDFTPDTLECSYKKGEATFVQPKCWFTLKELLPSSDFTETGLCTQLSDGVYLVVKRALKLDDDEPAKDGFALLYLEGGSVHILAEYSVHHRQPE